MGCLIEHPVPAAIKGKILSSLKGTLGLIRELPHTSVYIHFIVQKFYYSSRFVVLTVCNGCYTMNVTVCNGA